MNQGTVIVKLTEKILEEKDKEKLACKLGDSKVPSPTPVLISKASVLSDTSKKYMGMDMDETESLSEVRKHSNYTDLNKERNNPQKGKE